jgi:HPt (histidine-containing phosphotransfer) domain-containing protein
MNAVHAVPQVAAPPLQPADCVIDLDHLSRMTLGERSLEREVLALFDRQAEILLGRIREDAATAGAAAHTLKGSARGIGAWAVAQAAEAVERAGDTGLAATVGALGAAIADARLAIADLLRGTGDQPVAAD